MFQRQQSELVISLSVACGISDSYMKTEANFSLAVYFCFYIYLFSRNSKKDKRYRRIIVSYPSISYF